jgi:phosphate transport system substrate-binding protein
VVSRRDRHRTAGWSRRLGAALAVLPIVAGLSALAVAADAQPAGASVTVTGDGSSYAAVAINQWVAQVATIDQLNINYQTSSSVIGLNEFAQNQVNFGASEIGYSTRQADFTPPESYQYMPDIAGATCIMYNLANATGTTQIRNLQLNPEVLFGIFTGVIRQWNDPLIQDLNPGVALPNTQITRVIRSDPSGDNYIFSDYLYTMNPNGLQGPAGTTPMPGWNQFTSTMGTPPGAQAIYPEPSNGSGGQDGPYYIDNQQIESGSDYASGFVAANANSITYVETAYALLHHEPCASVLNASGSYVQPSSLADATALKHDELAPDLEQTLTGVFLAPEPSAYPISAYSYLITADAPNPPAAVGAVLGKFIEFLACQGQQTAGALGYSPIPPNLVYDDFAAINRLNGAAHVPPAPTAAECPNPYLQNPSSLPGEPVVAPSGGGGGGSTGAAVAGGSTGTTSYGGTVSSTATTAPNAAALAAAAAAAQAKANQVATKSAAKAVRESHQQIPGLALADAVGRLDTKPGPTSDILLWTALFVAAVAAVPLVAYASRRRRRSRPAGATEETS